MSQKKWPCYFSKSDTSGEKQFEEFVEDDEEIVLDRYQEIGVLKIADVATDDARLAELIEFCRVARTSNDANTLDYLREFAAGIPSFQHVAGKRNLDEKM